ncbi:uncharacterized protein LOC132259953 [Phlebotomus argentipes]|uniref:uncharacterized protein LOC132259953 n=1 Tax=Phlebotomus argentipes TaxID=94469 RepID=UPI002892AE75|nr:uncharacterized protein LOC132259953 [Phlebotomus argentipes]
MRVFKTINNGEIIIQLCNPKEDLEGVLHVLREGYMKSANTFIAFELDKPEASEARLEYEEMVKAVLFAGLSVVAREVRSNKIIGICLSHIHSRLQPGEQSFFEKFRDNSENKLIKDLLNFRIAKHKQINLFDMYNVDHYFEIVYGVTLPEYRRQDIAYHFVESTLVMAKETAEGKYPETMDVKLRGKHFKIVFASVSNKYSARLGEKLNFVVLKIFPFKDLKIDGVPLSEKVPSDHTESRLLVHKL